MSPKIAFQIGLLFMAFASVACGLFATDSHNKRVILLTIAGIVLVLNIGILFLRTPYSAPVVSSQIEMLESNYADGVSVDGVTWEPSFKQYGLELVAGKRAIHDVRAAFAFPGGVVGYRILSQPGCDQISFPQSNFSVRLIKGGFMLNDHPTLDNLLKFDIFSMNKDAKLKLRFILWFHPDLPDEALHDYGLYSLRFSYYDGEGKEHHVSRKYPILFKDKGLKQLYIGDEISTEAELKQYAFYHSIDFRQGVRIPFRGVDGITFQNNPSTIESD